jgi:hypothetical protein
LLNARPRGNDHEKAAPPTDTAHPIGMAAKFRRVSPRRPRGPQIDASPPFGVIDLPQPSALSMLVQVREATPAGVPPRAPSNRFSFSVLTAMVITRVLRRCAAAAG